MTTTDLNQNSRTLDQRQFLQVLTAGLALQEFGFMNDAIKEWLTVFPGDLQVHLMYVCLLYAKGRKQQANRRLSQLVEMEPFFLAAYLTQAQFDSENPFVNGAIKVLGGKVLDEKKLPVWAGVLQSLLGSQDEGNVVDVETAVDSLLHFSGENVLVDLVHLVYVMKNQSDDAVMILSRLYHERWPKCLQFKLVLADHAMRMGDEILGLELFQDCAKRDLAGLSAKRLWGENHPYLQIWPSSKEVMLSLTTDIPGTILHKMGWNQLTSGAVDQNSAELPGIHQDLTSFENLLSGSMLDETNVSEKTEIVTDNEEILSIFDQLSRSLGKKNVRKVEGRFPFYVILTSKNSLSTKYGPESTEILLSQMNLLVESIKQRPGWSGLVFTPDDNSQMQEFGLPIRNSKDPWDIKLGLSDLDRYLAKKGAMIGAILIVGGNDIVPFHQLPNPTEDSDLSVLSDNPYASIDENYFIPEWPIGRMPDENLSDPGLLLMQLRLAMKEHQKQNTSKKTSSGSLAFSLEVLVEFFIALFGGRQNDEKTNSVGYSAAIWRRSSIGAYRPIGSANLVAISPPTTSKNIDRLWLSEVEYAYFNLHGIQDGPEWFGQKDFVDGSEGPDYPIALQPQDISSAPKYRQVVFSEACYGAYVENKSADQSIALRYLANGCKGFVGSTGIAYGSIQPPLIGADLLAFLFWKYLQEGYTTGDALLHAKVELAREMQKRQEFLDGEDQKTLLSFVLYGDPLVQAVVQDTAKAKRVEREKLTDMIMIFSETDTVAHEPIRLSEKTIAEVKQVLSSYLPGLAESDYFLYQQFILDTDSSVQKFKLGAPEKLKRHESGNVVLSFRKEISYREEHHQYYAKATVDVNGKIIKLAVSR